jgi:glycosyltransferase involved in cell wall biosynthesis
MRISVCLASFNGEKFIAEQLDSILCQLSEDDELIISDDRSADATINIIQSFNDPRIKLYSNQPTNKKDKINSYNVTRNFENALKHVNGEIICLSDQDDVWDKGKVKEIMNVFQNRAVGLVVHDALVVNEQNNLISDSYFSLLQSKPGFIKNIVKNSYLGCCMAFRKNLLDRIMPFPENLIAHDMWIGLLAEKMSKVVFIPQKLIRYRRHLTSATNAGEKSTHKLFFRLFYRIQFLWQYFSRVLFNGSR